MKDEMRRERMAREGSPRRGGGREGGRGGGRGMMRGGRVELEEGWRNRPRSPLLPPSAGGGEVKLEPLDSVKGGGSREAEEEEAMVKTEGPASGGVKEEPEALAEDFSDFGDSDDDILNQEDDSKEDVKGEVSSRPSSRGTSPRVRKRRGDGGLEGVLGVEEAGQEKGEAEELVKSNAR